MARNLSGFEDISKNPLRVGVSEGTGDDRYWDDGGGNTTRGGDKVPRAHVMSSGGIHVDCDYNEVVVVNKICTWGRMRSKA
jgi:hypothetical protein